MSLSDNINKLDTGHWNKIKRGDEQAFMEIYDGHYQSLFTFGCRINPAKEIVKDAIHELFCELWEKRTSLPQVTNEKS